MKNTNKPRTKNSTRENIDLFVQKISEAGLIGYQDNTPTHINDLITEKAKEPKKFRYGFIRSKDKKFGGLPPLSCSREQADLCHSDNLLV